MGWRKPIDIRESGFGLIVVQSKQQKVSDRVIVESSGNTGM
jgi:hypothetical protein